GSRPAVATQYSDSESVFWSSYVLYVYYCAVTIRFGLYLYNGIQKVRGSNPLSSTTRNSVVDAKSRRAALTKRAARNAWVVSRLCQVIFWVSATQGPRAASPARGILKT